MRHLDQELLAGIALGEPDALTPRDRAHLLVCQDCTAALAALRHIVDTGRDAARPDLHPPRPEVLAQILTELDDPPAPGQRADASAREQPPVDLSSRRPLVRPVRRYAIAAVAAAAVLAVTFGGVFWYHHDRDVVVARATLEPLPDKSGRGSAELVRKGGMEELAVTVRADGVADRFEELWLINTDGQRMISLGVVPPDGRGTYPVPAASGGALDGYTIVDISLEPFDGNAAHSHNSLLRGTLA